MTPWQEPFEGFFTPKQLDRIDIFAHSHDILISYSWDSIWMAMARLGFVDSWNSAEYHKRTQEMLAEGRLRVDENKLVRVNSRKLEFNPLDHISG